MMPEQLIQKWEEEKKLNPHMTAIYDKFIQELKSTLWGVNKLKTEKDHLLSTMKSAYTQFKRFEQCHGTSDCQAAMEMGFCIEEVD